MFGKKPEHTRGSYEDAERDLEKEQANFKREFAEGKRSISGHNVDVDTRTTDKRMNEAYEKLNQLKEQGHEEALELNKQYDELRDEAKEAMRKLRRFEVDKLGMKE